MRHSRSCPVLFILLFLPRASYFHKHGGNVIDLDLTGLSVTLRGIFKRSVIHQQVTATRKLSLSEVWDYYYIRRFYITDMAGSVRNRDPAIRALTETLELCKTKNVDAEITEKINAAIDLAEQRDQYCESISSEPSAALKSLYDETITHPFQKAFNDGKTVWNLSPRMMSGHFEGKFLQSVVSMCRAKSVLEVGMFTGYAALACAEVLPEDGKVMSLEIDPYLETLARKLVDKSEHGKKITMKIGPASESLEALVKEGAQFDVVFIDADKKGYINYFKSVIDGNLLSPGGTVVLDNALMGGHAYLKDSTNENGLAIRQMNEYIRSRDDLFTVLVPIRDGALIVRRKSDVCK